MIDSSVLETFKIIIANVQVENKARKFMYIYEKLLVANTKVKVVLEIHFLKFSNANILFKEKILIWKSYTTSKALSIIKQVYIIYKIFL